MNIHLQL